MLGQIKYGHAHINWLVEQNFFFMVLNAYQMWALRLISEFSVPRQSAVASHQLFFERFPSSCQTPETGKQKKRPVKQESSRTVHKVCRDLKQRVQRNPRVTYGIVHQLVKVLFKVIRGCCPEFRVLKNVWGHSVGLMEGENFVDFDNTQAKRQIKLRVSIV